MRIGELEKAEEEFFVDSYFKENYVKGNGMKFLTYQIDLRVCQNHGLAGLKKQNINQMIKALRGTLELGSVNKAIIFGESGCKKI